VVVPKLRTFGRSVLVADPKDRTFGRSVLAGPVVVPRLRTFGRSVLVEHNDPATRLARAAGIVTRLVRANRRANRPAMQVARLAGIVTRLVRVNINRRGNNRRRDPGRPRPEGSPARAKETRANAIALRGEGDLGSGENARCKTLGPGCPPQGVAHARLPGTPGGLQSSSLTPGGPIEVLEVHGEPFEKMRRRSRSPLAANPQQARLEKRT
jgi:hypothetical protein